jgi:peptide deformylase
MTVRDLRILGRPGDEILREPARPVDRFDSDLQTLIDDMIETMHANYGVGLAAPQIGIGLQLVVIDTGEIPPFALINGAVAHHSGERTIEEGCLSIPGYRGDMRRAVKVVAKGLDRFGRAIRIRAADDTLAQALEHEIDHTRGLLYVDLLQNGEHLHRIPISEGREPALITALPHQGANWEPPEWRARLQAEAERPQPEQRYRHGAAPRFVVPRYRKRETDRSVGKPPHRRASA